MFRYTVTYHDGINSNVHFADTDNSDKAIDFVNELLMADTDYTVCLFDSLTMKREYFKLAE